MVLSSNTQRNQNKHTMHSTPVPTGKQMSVINRVHEITGMIMASNMMNESQIDKTYMPISPCHIHIHVYPKDVAPGTFCG